MQDHCFEREEIPKKKEKSQYIDIMLWLIQWLKSFAFAKLPFDFWIIVFSFFNSLLEGILPFQTLH